MDSVDRALFRLRNLLAGLPLAYALVSTRWEWENDWGDWSVATGLCLAGLVLRSWASAHCYYGRAREKRLARTGPYALVRNPLYLGNLFIIAGATFASELVWMLPISVIWAWGVYSVVCASYEERKLLRWYGEEYRRYRSAVPAWIPVNAGVASFSPVSWRLLMAQSPRLLLLLPFILKEWRWLGLGS